MLLRTSFNCALVLTLTLHHIKPCSSLAHRNQRLSVASVAAKPSPIINGSENKINVKNVTFDDKRNLLINSKYDKSQNSREFPSSVRHKRNSDKSYHGINYDNDSVAGSATQEPSECILSRSEHYLSWWVHEDGSLKLPATNRDGSTTGFVDLSFKYQSETIMFEYVSKLTADNPKDIIIFLSMANNELKRLPVETLRFVSISLQYLSLANNDLSNMFNYINLTLFWDEFPWLKSLKELDLRNCSLTVLEPLLFEHLFSLEKLFLSHNMLEYISDSTFAYLTNLKHLDLSYQEIVQPFYLGFNQMDPFSKLFTGLFLEEHVFDELSSLTFLDLSQTKLKQESVRALQLQNKVEQLSLCYTDLPMIAPGMFLNTKLKVLDLSGNPGLASNMNWTWFRGLEDSLEIFVFEHSNIKNLEPLRNLRKLRMISLENNNINQVQASNFVNFVDLEILDLNTNHISNWYERTFEYNTRLRIVNLRNNNINLMTTEMLEDLGNVSFLAIGSNNFVCECLLREFIKRAKFNAMAQQCGVQNQRRKRDLPDEFYDPKYYYDVLLREYYGYISGYEKSYKNIVSQKESNRDNLRTFESKIKPNDDRLNDFEIVPESCIDLESNSSMTFDFLLLDYNENDYHCIETTGSSNEKVPFNEISPCPENTYQSTPTLKPLPGTPPTSHTDAYTDAEENDRVYEENDRPDNKLENKDAAGTLLIIYLSIGLPLTLLCAVWFWKRKDIRYFCAVFRNSLILSFDNDDNKSLMMKNRRKSNSNDDQYRFDLFVSYSDKDRDFVLDQLLPNLEKRSEITICLHERDFQVGLSILENIIQCMDQSRCLLLVISESFLKSNWCSFEMHLAQHRLIETRREQLILVLLEDIPKIKRPRTLNYLMRTKTYILWPKEDKEELRNVFWKRLKKAVVLNNWEPERTSKKPRHSIV